MCIGACAVAGVIFGTQTIWAAQLKAIGGAVDEIAGGTGAAVVGCAARLADVSDGLGFLSNHTFVVLAEEVDGVAVLVVGALVLGAAAGCWIQEDGTCDIVRVERATANVTGEEGASFHAGAFYFAGAKTQNVTGHNHRYIFEILSISSNDPVDLWVERNIEIGEVAISVKHGAGAKQDAFAVLTLKVRGERDDIPVVVSFAESLRDSSVHKGGFGAFDCLPARERSLEHGFYVLLRDAFDATRVELPCDGQRFPTKHLVAGVTVGFVSMGCGCKTQQQHKQRR